MDWIIGIEQFYFNNKEDGNLRIMEIAIVVLVLGGLI